MAIEASDEGWTGPAVSMITSKRVTAHCLANAQQVKLPLSLRSSCFLPHQTAIYLRPPHDPNRAMA